jgi:hypothetical protein
MFISVCTLKPQRLFQFYINSLVRGEVPTSRGFSGDTRPTRSEKNLWSVST